MTDGGRRSVRSLSGLRRDSEVMYVPKYEITQANNPGRRGKISGLFENDPEGGLTGSSVRRLSRGVGGSEPEDDDDNDDEDDENPNRLSRSLSQPDYINQAGLYQTGSAGGPSFTNQGSISSREHTGGVSIFERPGFGSVAFRKNMNSTLSNFASFSAQYSSNNNSSNSQQNNRNNRMMEGVLAEEDDNDDGHGKKHRDSIGSASSLDGRSKAQSGSHHKHHRNSNWADDGEPSLGDGKTFLRKSKNPIIPI